MWIVNGGDEAIQSDACELFGFNVGQFSDKSLGRAWWVLKFRANSSWRCCAGRRGQGHPIPAGVGYCPQVHVIPGSAKTLRCFADICAHAAQKMGITEISLLDHDASQRIEAGFSLAGLSFRVRMVRQWLFAISFLRKRW